MDVIQKIVRIASLYNHVQAVSCENVVVGKLCISGLPSNQYTVQLLDEMLPIQTKNLHQKIGGQVGFLSFVR